MNSVSTQLQELSNDLVRFTIAKKPGSLVEFDVHASKKLVEDARAQAIKAVAKEVTLPGFRKGRAPDSIIAKNYPKEIDRKWQECIAEKAFRSCEPLAKTPRLNRETKASFSMKSHSKEEAHLTLTYEVEPEIPSVDPAKCTLKEVARPEVNAAKVQETIRQVLFFFAHWTPVEDRGAEEGDFVVLDVDITETTPHVSLFKDTRFEVKNTYMAKWMKDLVLGKKVGDSAEGISCPDDDVKPEEKEAFKPQKTKITVKAIHLAKLPELTETFLKNLGVNSEEELQASIEKLLTKQADDHVKEAHREQVNAFLLTTYPFDLPATLIEKETQFRLRQLSQDVNFQEYWKNLDNEGRKNTINSIYQQSEKAVRMFYLCRKILADAQISVSPKDLPAPASTPLEVLMDPNQMLDYHQKPEIKHAEALSRLVLEKAEDFIITNAVKGSLNNPLA